MKKDEYYGDEFVESYKIIQICTGQYTLHGNGYKEPMLSHAVYGLDSYGKVWKQHPKTGEWVSMDYKKEL